MHKVSRLVLSGLMMLSLLSCGKGEKGVNVEYDSDFEFSGELWEPCDMTMDSEGNLYILDRFEGACVHKFDPSGVYLGKIGSLGKGRGELFLPLSLAVSENGQIWVADRVNKRLTRYSSEGECLMVIGPEDEFQMEAPEAMVIGADGVVYIADSLANTIWRVEPIGTVQIYRSGDELHNPEDIMWMDGGLLVVDSGAGRLLMPDGGSREVVNVDGEEMIPHKIKEFGGGYVLLASKQRSEKEKGSKYQPYLLMLDGEFNATTEHKLDPELVGDVVVVSEDMLLVSFPKMHRVVRYKVVE